MNASSLPRIALGTDHAGFAYKESIKSMLLSLGHPVKDFGTFSDESVDYPDFVTPAAKAVAQGVCDLGVVLGGSGNGEAIAANKVTGIRCALCWNPWSARMAKRHNNANVISIGARTVSEAEALEMVQIWLAEEFEGGRHGKRIARLEDTGLLNAPLPEIADSV